MAHIAKYKATSVGHMLAHYRRDESSLGRDNIDPKRVKNDMVVAHYTEKMRLEATLKGLEAKLATSQARLQTLTDEQTRLSEDCR